MILLRMKAYPKIKWSLDSTLIVGNCPEVLIVAQIPKQEARYLEQPEDRTKLSAHMENKCTINFFEPFVICSLNLICFLLSFIS